MVWVAWKACNELNCFYNQTVLLLPSAMQVRKRTVLWVLCRVFVVLIWYQSKQSWVEGNQNLIHSESERVLVSSIPWLSMSFSSWAIAIRVQSGSIDISRNEIIWGLISEWFTWRASHPYTWYVTNGLMSYQGTWVLVRQNNEWVDALDTWIIDTQQKLNEEGILKDTIWIWSWVRTTRQDILLFKNSNDLQELWYEVISTRRRISADVEYRRKNISQSFSLIWHIRVIPPSGDLTFMEAAQYDGVTRENYEYWYVVIGNQEKMDYGGGICGASSAIYQWIVWNWSLQTPWVRNHTRWYGNLYDAYIDGELVTTPWIDSAVFDGSLDLEMVNTASHPIVLVMNYDGTLWWVEEVFTIGRPDDRQDIEFVSSYPITYTWPSWIGTWEITTRWGCYTWLIGEETVKRCYRKVSQ